jgi:hypothetical protein
MSSIPDEAKVILALEALKNDDKLSIRAAAKVYAVPYTTLYDRRAGRHARRDVSANSRKLTDLEEQTIVQYVIELCTRSFPPRLCGVEDMANELLRARDASDVGIPLGYQLRTAPTRAAYAVFSQIQLPAS